jgi:hypothetical protein
MLQSDGGATGRRQAKRMRSETRFCCFIEAYRLSAEQRVGSVGRAFDHCIIMQDDGILLYEQQFSKEVAKATCAREMDAHRSALRHLTVTCTFLTF